MNYCSVHFTISVNHTTAYNSRTDTGIGLDESLLLIVLESFVLAFAVQLEFSCILKSETFEKQAVKPLLASTLHPRPWARLIPAVAS